ncbi:TPA: hypothetical protein I4D24_06450 [Enterobacter hormaechei]|nr:hypothetical protein FYA23_17590 [Enterobacter hormaechei]QEI72880.1 hypothetical protein FYA22_17595 [Enterobacter hormaechei]HAS1384330.1 hypothetical protein [Enterobacter hormaechei]
MLLVSKELNRCSWILKHRFILYYCDLFLRHSLNGGNVIGVETLFQYSEGGGIFDFSRSFAAGHEEEITKQKGSGNKNSHAAWLTTRSDSRSTDVPIRHSDNSYILV